MPLPLRVFANTVISRQFLLFLETLSGIDCLLADPYFIGGGAMATGPGEFLKTDVKETEAVPQSIPRRKEGFDKGHYMEWIEACKGGPAALSNMVDFSGPMTEAGT